MTQRALLGEHGAVGDMESLALVDRFGSIDWFCWPRFDAPSLFGAILDADGGHWSVRPRPADRDELEGHDERATDAVHSRQMYLSETNVLITRFHTATGIAEVEDLMTVDGPRRLVRRVLCQRGTASIEVEVAPRPDYGRIDPRLSNDGGSLLIEWGDESLTLSVIGASSTFDVDRRAGTARLTFDVDAGDDVLLVLHESSSPSGDLTRAAIELAIDDTIAFWQRWTGRSTYRGRWRQAVERSALALKLLTHRSSGGLIAAGTASIPEHIGGQRNWDYRYVWIRDAAFTVYAFLELGHVDEADAFAAWLVDRLDGCEQHDEPLVPLYDLDGRREVPEYELDHWSGYADSRPVRIGNGASGQRQLDIYGELIDSLYLTDRHGDGLPVDAWRHVCALVDRVIEGWREPDQGMWEIRSPGERHTSSVLMCWVAVERAMRMATARGRPAELDRWRRARDEMHAELLDEGWNDEVGAFTRVFGGDDVDASILLAPLVKFLPGDDPRWLRTLDAIDEQLAHGPLVDRYDTDVVDDGVGGDEGSFLICSFWYVEAMARAGRVDDAHRLFDRLLTYANPVGLYSEQVGPDGHLLGNFPQAFTHLALISAAIHLDEALDADRG